MAGTIKEPWQREVVAREASDAMCMMSYIANLLYPTLVIAADREAKLKKSFPDFVAAVEPLLQRRRIEAMAMLGSYDQSKAA